MVPPVPLIERGAAPFLLPAAALSALAGGGCGDDRPQVPFSAAPVAASSAPPAPASASSGFDPVVAEPAPGDGSTFELDGQTLRPRAGRVFKRALAFDADGDETSDLVAWTEARDGRRGEIAFFRGGEAAAAETALAPLPKDVDIDRCTRDLRLARIAPTLVVVEATGDCTAPNRREQWVAIVRLDAARSRSAPRAPELRLEIRAHAPLEVSVRAVDRDRDGHDDVELVARLAGSAAASASMVFLDRPAGYAIDPTEPEASLAKLGQSLAARAKSADVREEAMRIVELGAALCDDFGGRPALVTSSGGARCGEARFAADATYASAISWLAAGDVGRAATALDALASIKNDGGRRAQLEKALEPKAAPVEASIVRRVAARPQAKAGLLSPFAFDLAGKLLVQTDAGVVEVDVASGEETASQAIPWPRTVAWMSGDTTVELVGAEAGCDPDERRLLATARQAETRVVLPSIAARLAPAKSKCKPSKLPVSPLVVDGTSATVAVGGEAFRLTFGDRGLSAEPATALGVQGLSPPGASRTADGSVAALALAGGVLFVRSGGAEIWRGPDLAGLRGCVPSPAGDRVACLGRSGVVILGRK